MAAAKLLLSRLGLGAAATASAGIVAVGSDEGLGRAASFWSRAFPVYLHYRFVEVTTWHLPSSEIDAAFEVLHDRWAPFVRDLTYDLKGYYLKNAQICSTRPDILPPQYLRWAKKTMDAAPVNLTPAGARAVVESELGRSLEEVFSEWEAEPFGSASIGQVHRARLRSNGAEVAVKVMAPGVEAMFRNDLSTIRTFCKLAQPQYVLTLDEVERGFETEFDYVGEAQNLQLVRRNLLAHGWGNRVVVPEPYLELCTRRVLVQEYLPGERLDKGVRDQFARFAARRGLTLEELEEEQRALAESGNLRPMTLAGSRRRAKAYRWALRAGDALANAPRACVNTAHAMLTLGLARKPLVPYRRSELPINLAELLELLIQVHAHEVFVDGAFNGDPHPGNILLLRDGRIGLIDYGNVKHISLETQLAYARLVLALADDRKEDVIELMKASGFVTQRMDPDILYKIACFWHDRDDDETRRLPGYPGRLNLQQFMDAIEKLDPCLQIPEWSVMLSRLSLMMRGMGLAFGVQLRVAKAYRGHAEALLRAHGELA
mmetsp:Transcript_28404/g.92763  ORF Transcript_28404/g.92763 Transcript_28404/m.92763 type:complete len:545 (+) Transcript_28404:1128-2762(+)